MSQTSSISGSAGIEFREDLACHVGPFLLLVTRFGALMFFLGFLDADVVQVGGRKSHRGIALFLLDEPFRVAGNSCGMADPLEILLEIELHLHCHSVFEEVLLLLYQLWRKLSKTMLRKLAMGCAAEVHLRVEHLMPAFLAPAPRLIFEEFNSLAAFGALGVKDGVEFPEAWVLSRAFHGFSLFPSAHLRQRL